MELVELVALVVVAEERALVLILRVVAVLPIKAMQVVMDLLKQQ